MKGKMKLFLSVCGFLLMQATVNAADSVQSPPDVLATSISGGGENQSKPWEDSGPMNIVINPSVAYAAGFGDKPIAQLKVTTDGMPYIRGKSAYSYYWSGYASPGSATGGMVSWEVATDWDYNNKEYRAVVTGTGTGVTCKWGVSASGYTGKVVYQVKKGSLVQLSNNLMRKTVNCGG